jgi:hypothetical protein
LATSLLIPAMLPGLLLESLRARLPGNASNKVRFRVLANLGVAHHRLGDYDAAAVLFLESSPLNPDEPVSLSNRGLGARSRSSHVRRERNQFRGDFPQAVGIAQTLAIFDQVILHKCREGRPHS